MHWIQLKANIAPALADAMEESLLAAGASAVTMEDAKDQPILEPERGTTPLWDSTVITGLFSADENLEQIKTIAQNVYQNLTQNDLPEYRVEILENQDWSRKWMEHFKPIKFGSQLWICPSWHEIPDKNAVNLMLDPGLAFGTGTHPTTSLCLKWLDEQASSSTNFINKTVTDYGCGSGILGIAALLLGAKSVSAIDNDPQALLATHDNAERNKIAADKIITALPEDACIEQTDIVLANILASPLYKLKNRLADLTKSGGKVVLSGILEDQAEALLIHYSDRFKMDQIVLENGWARLTGTKNT